MHAMHVEGSPTGMVILLLLFDLSLYERLPSGITTIERIATAQAASNCWKD